MEKPCFEAYKIVSSIQDDRRLLSYIKSICISARHRSHESNQLLVAWSQIGHAKSGLKGPSGPPMSWILLDSNGNFWSRDCPHYINFM